MVLIIGSGAGGGILGLELAKANIPVTIIEKGPYCESKNALNYYNNEVEGMDLLQTSCVGGSTIVSAGNGLRSLEEDFKKMGIDLNTEFSEIETLLNIHTLDKSHIGKLTNRFLASCEKLNLNVMNMPKFIDESKCIQCGNCAFGCPVDAKWSSKDFIDSACENGAELICQTKATKLLIEDSAIKGVEVIDSNGNIKELYSDIVILSSGAITTPFLLQSIGIDCGNQFFTDPFVTVGGFLKDSNYNREIQMNGLVKSDHFILAPHFSQFIVNQLKNVKPEDIFSIMVKIPDEGKGHVKNGDIIKENTIRDLQYLAEGTTTAGMILTDLGVDPNTIVSTVFRSAHPGGTAAIGQVVNTDLESEIKGLYVCDSSVLPKAPGAPPILTILALAKRLSKKLIADLS